MSRTSYPILSILKPMTAARFFRKLRPAEGGCLEFTGSKNKAGYGFVDVSYNYGERRYAILTHRLAWALGHGMDPPDGAIICHRCNNPSCCNPEHLYAGTHLDNAADMVRAGRSCKGARGALYMVRGTAHPRALYSQEVKDRVIQLRREAMPYAQIRRITGVTEQTASRWWGEVVEDAAKRRSCQA